MSKRQKDRHCIAQGAEQMASQHIFPNQNAQPVLDGIYCKYFNVLGLREPGEPASALTQSVPPAEINWWGWGEGREAPISSPSSSWAGLARWLSGV